MTEDTYVSRYPLADRSHAELYPFSSQTLPRRVIVLNRTTTIQTSTMHLESDHSLHYLPVPPLHLVFLTNLSSI